MPCILLTGATGYIASHTWLALQEAGFDANTQSAYLAGPRPMTFHYWGEAQAA